MKVEQFVMAYKVEQDHLRAMLPDGFESLRPVLRINTEIRNTDKTETIYIELNTPVESDEKKGWLNIANWESPELDITYTRNGNTVSISSPFLELAYTGVGVVGSCPAERDNDGCFFLDEQFEFRPNELIKSNREFCDCEFKWKFTDKDAFGISIGDKSIPAFPTEPKNEYDPQNLTAQNAASIECETILGSYVVSFER